MKLCKKIIVLLVIVILAGTVLPATPSQAVVYDYRQSKSLYHIINTCSSTDIQIYTPISWTTVWDLGLKPCSICNPQPPSDLNLSTNFTTQPSDKYFHKTGCTALNSTSLKITMDLKTLLSTGRVPCRTCKPELPLTSTVIVVPTDPNELIGPVGPQGEKGDKGDTGPKGDKGDTGLMGEKGESAWKYPAGKITPYYILWFKPYNLITKQPVLNEGYWRSWTNGCAWNPDNGLPAGIYVWDLPIECKPDVTGFVVGNWQEAIDAYIDSEILAGKLQRTGE